MDVEIPLQKLAVADKLNISIDELSTYMFVITTFERCVKLRQLQYATANDEELEAASALSHELSVVLGIRWQRLVVDEGHDLAVQVVIIFIFEYFKYLILQSEVSAATAALAAEFICEISAEKRWCMSGTPTTGTESITAFTQLQRLLVFLRHKDYGIDGEESVARWTQEIVKPLLNSNQTSFAKLVSLLDGLLIQHVKVLLSISQCLIFI